MTGAIAEMVPERRDDCTCPFDAPGQAPPVTDPKSACFDDCLRAFLMRKYGQRDINRDVCQNISDSGGGGAAFYPLYYLDHKWCGLHWNDPAALYQDPGVDKIINSCNGSVRCSYSITVQQHTDSLISYGFRNFVDPGVPPASYQCSTCSSSTPKQANSPQSPEFTALSASTTSTSVELATTEETMTTSTSAISSSLSEADTTGAAYTRTATLYTDTFLPTSTAATPAATRGHTLPTEAIVAIAVCTTLALVSAVILLVCVLRRRQKQLGEHDGDIRSRISRIVQGFAAPADSPQRLISPSQSYCTDRPPLTPPLPLRDRKLLPSLLGPISRPASIALGSSFERHHSNNSQSSCYSSHRQDGKDSFPSSPICSPTYNRLEPRQEKMHQAAPSLVTSAASLTSEPSSPPYTRLKSPPPVSFTFPPSSQDSTTHPVSPCPKGRTSSLRNEITSTTSTSSSNYNTHGMHPNSTGSATISVIDAADNPSISTSPSAPTPPSSPIRPRRPHEGPLEIPDLVSPLSSPRSPSPGPPPSKALPPPPLCLRPSPASLGIGIATTTGARAGCASPQSRPEYGYQVHHHRPDRHHNQHHRRGQGTAAADGGRAASRDSWGSWEDLTPATLIGRAISPPAGGAVYTYPDNQIG